MSHEVETMAYANAVPWHGLGAPVSADISVDEMLVAAGLNWTVEQHPAWITIDGEAQYTGQMALVRSSDGKVLTNTSEQWKPVQNYEILEFFRAYTESGGATLETAGSLRGGKTIWGLAALKAGFTLKGKDEVKAYLLMTSHHQLGFSTTGRMTAVRVVCANTMAAAHSADIAQYRQNHTADFSADEARKVIGEAVEDFHALELDAKALMQLKLSDFDTLRVLARHFQPVEVADESEKTNIKSLEALLDPANQNKDLTNVGWSIAEAPGATPNTGWGVFNGVTHWADHVKGRKDDTRLYSAWYGNTARIKNAVKRDLLEMVD